MMLIDAGPLIALLDKRDQAHAACVEVMQHVANVALISTWPCFAEAMYALGAAGGYRYQAELWKLVFNGDILLRELTWQEIQHASVLMERYQDVPMDLGDASLVALADALQIRRLVTLDSDFRIYRLADDSVFDVLP
jgi:predicted nucleic acid-binding protein